MEQLRMEKLPGNIVTDNLPDGYRYEYFTGTEEEIEDWLVICRGALLSENAGRDSYVCAIENYPDLIPEENLFFVVSPEGKRVATTTHVFHPKENAGYVHMVACLPEYRGKGIGKAMLTESLVHLEAKNPSYIYLTTDDFRLSAICTYLKAGFKPAAMDIEGMNERWNAIYDKLKLKNY